MNPESITPGILVVNSGKPEWGLGKVLLIHPAHVWVYFKDIEGAPKDAIKKLSLNANRLELAETQTDIALDNLPSMVRDGKIHVPERRRLTEQQAIDAFFKRYKGGFSDSNYEKNERSYKWAAHEEVARTFLAERARTMLVHKQYSELAALLKRIVHQAGLLGVQELIALNEAFKDHEATARYVEALLPFLERFDAATFEPLIEATGSLPAAAGRAKVLTWPTVTLMPFLARPDKAMFLKPEMTQRVAETFSFELFYTPRPNWSTYSQLLRLSAQLLARLRPLGAVDLIDVQSFMWVVAGEPYRRVPDPESL